MKKNFWIILFVIVLLADLAAVYLGNENMRYVTKPLLMPLLAVYFISNTKDFVSSLRKWIVLALLFSWAGDVLLMFESVNSNFFLFGLVAFLVAHLFYIVFFRNVQSVEKVSSKWIMLILVLVYYFTLMYVLNPSLGEMLWPVRVYGLVISVMFLSALHCFFIKQKDAGKLMVIGALLFVISDSVLAFNKFYQSFEFAGIIIMLTYGLAQLLITVGAVKYITSIAKR